MSKNLESLKLYEHDYLNWLRAKKDYPGINHPKPKFRGCCTPAAVLRQIEDRVERDFNRPVA